MKRIQDIKATRQQQFQTPLENGNYVTFDVHYFPAIQQWSLDVSYREFEVFGLRICNSLNILQQYSLLIPFGVMIQTNDGGEPFLITDFSTSRVQFFVLDQSKIEQIDSFLKTGVVS